MRRSAALILRLSLCETNQYLVPRAGICGIFLHSVHLGIYRRVSLSQAITRITMLGLIIASVAWFNASHIPLKQPPGVLAPADPSQTDFITPQPEIAKEGWTLKPLALYTITARVLGKEHYTSDTPSTLAPWDLALGWGRMSDTAVLERLDIWQSGRFYGWQYWGSPPIPEQEIMTHSATNHIIPADDYVKGKLAGLRVGTVVRIIGQLVEATHPLGDHPWRSSLRRDDTGDGACEIIYAKFVEEVKPPR